ncbi:ABC transporter ATP-binding protein [Engelhardtia mirabilis]|uniref:Putative ABC transporter ATP-binding protein YxlF n=1 Tax=Engelhardtia mirabilis TaxID=2528011 RepID=A0A518BJS7_9BACT|nr:putative ABC transporter ATP-binding protein YxlF [Planctomycetes bacterium Pla133]QDV01542.1 putative ABC transporter ATP-binding protein YxlF [Planctomycetes bacterium Pla86]
MIDARDLTKTFGAHTAVDDISFRLEQGEVVGFLGPNGAGKTTTMRMLTGYLPATRGTIRVGGFDVLRESMQVRRRLGYLPENVPLYREYRVEEMLLFQARLHRMSKADAKRRCGEVLEQVGLTDRRRSRIGDLSRGLRQRAGLAVALLPNPDVLILDEPTSGLDPIQRLEVRALIRDLAAQHTVLLSSHILAEVEAVCPRVIILAEGRIAADGTPERLVSELGGGGHVRFEAVVGDAAVAREILESLPGVSRVEDDGRLGIHHQFDVYGSEDLREDVGALSAAKGWAIRELSWRQPTLEQLFARIALGLDKEAQLPSDRPVVTAPAADEPVKLVYNLDPFAGGAERPLDAPVDAAAAKKPAAPTLNPFENFGQSAPAAPPKPAGPTLNPFENFGRPAPSEDDPNRDVGGEG